MKSQEKVCILFLITISFYFITSSVCSAQIALPYGSPKANKQIYNLVPVSIAEKIAFKKARDQWGKVSPGPYLEACDDDGDIVAYLFTFSIGASKFPNYKDIIAKIKYGREIADKGVKSMHEDDKQKVKEKEAIELENFENALYKIADDVDAADPQPKPRFPTAEQIAKKIGHDMMTGADQFGTVVVSARYDLFPVPLYMHYLPPYFYQGDIAMEKAKKLLSAQKVSLEKLYFFERERAPYFEFTAQGKSILLNQYNLEAAEANEILTKKGKKPIPDLNEMDEITAEWDKSKKELYGNF